MQTVFSQDDLEAIENKIWELLSLGVESYKNPFHTGVFANMQDGNPEVRTVIMRRADQLERKLYFHTDIRSPKFEWLQKNPQVSWLFYHEPLRLQFRMSATAMVHQRNDVADQGWHHSKMSSKLTYSCEDAPGNEQDEPVLLDINIKNPSDSILAFARTNFSVVETKIEKIDWVFLHHQGNRRGEINYLKDKKTWLQP